MELSLVFGEVKANVAITSRVSRHSVECEHR